MNESFHPVIVFHAANELEAQMARDHLEAAMIPTLHVPNLTTGLFGMRQNLKVAVPEDRVEEAIEVLQEAGFAAGREPRPTGTAAVDSAMRDALPGGGAGIFLRILLVFLLLAMAVVVIRAFREASGTGG